MARLITLILIGVLMAGQASAKDIAKALAGDQEATDPASMGQRRAYEKEKSVADYARQVLALPPLSPEEIEKYRAEDAAKGIKPAPALQKMRQGLPPWAATNPWDK